MLLLLEGCPGAGKSTFCGILDNFFNRREVKIIYEPDFETIITNNGYENLLEKYYNDQPRWGFTFQLWCMFTKVEILKSAMARYPVVIAERSLWSDREVFTNMLYQTGNMTDIEHCMHERWFQFLLSDQPKVDGVVYLRASPEVSLARLKIRNRKGEAEKVNLAYMKKVHDMHDQWLYGPSSRINVLTVNADIDICENHTAYHNIFGTMIDTWPVLSKYRYGPPAAQRYMPPHQRMKNMPQFFHQNRKGRFAGPGVKCRVRIDHETKQEVAKEIVEEVVEEESNTIYLPVSPTVSPPSSPVAEESNVIHPSVYENEDPPQENNVSLTKDILAVVTPAKKEENLWCDIMDEDDREREKDRVKEKQSQLDEDNGWSRACSRRRRKQNRKYEGN